jgi:hypothetical protein
VDKLRKLNFKWITGKDAMKTMMTKGDFINKLAMALHREYIDILDESARAAAPDTVGVAMSDRAWWLRSILQKIAQEFDLTAQDYSELTLIVMSEPGNRGEGVGSRAS